MPEPVQDQPNHPPPQADLESLFQEHHSQVFQAAYRVTGNPADAEDVMQTVFSRLAARPRPWSLAPHPGAYLRRAAVNAALDTVRTAGRRLTVPLEVVPGGKLAATDGDPDRAHRDREAKVRLRKALAEVPGRWAEMFVLKYVEGMSNKEIAGMVGTSAGVVGVTLLRARRRIQMAFADMGDDSHEA